MKCKKQFKYHKLPISNLWEVELDIDLWDRICNVARYRRCTYSWISRYCVFRLAMRRKVSMRPAMEYHINRIKHIQKNSKKTHRQIICLYGDDEKILRIAAMSLGITISQLIRLAIYWFLPKIEKQIVTWAEIFYRGTKICQHLDTKRQNKLRMPFWENSFFTKWPLEKWWKRPRYIIAIPYTLAGNPKKYAHFIPLADDDTLDVIFR